MSSNQDGSFASVSGILRLAGRKRRQRRASSSSSSDDDTPKVLTAHDKPSGFFHDRRIVSDADFAAEYTPSLYEANFR